MCSENLISISTQKQKIIRKIPQLFEFATTLPGEPADRQIMRQ
jgi:hypothetical protein